MSNYSSPALATSLGALTAVTEPDAFGVMSGVAPVLIGWRSPTLAARLSGQEAALARLIWAEAHNVSSQAYLRPSTWLAAKAGYGAEQ